MLNRREFLATAAVGTIAAGGVGGASAAVSSHPQIPGGSGKRPNVLYVFSDQWRHTDHGYAGNTEVHTPNLDRFSKQSVNFTHAVAGIPVCCPHRASLITGKRPLTHGLFLNDLSLSDEHQSMGHCFREAGHRTGWIGKWHIDGRGRDAFIPRERRQGFEHWQVLECTHNYNRSAYYEDEPVKKFWDGYDAFSQTRAAESYIRDRAAADDDAPFALVLSWGPPHAPYHTAPAEHRARFENADLTLRANVPDEKKEVALEELRGYYAHMSALDKAFGDLMKTLEETGMAEDTIVVYTSDHGDMLHSHGNVKKQQPWDESLRVPFLIRWPAKLKNQPREIDMPLDTPDILPTLLGLTGIDIPQDVDGMDLSGVVLGTEEPLKDHAALITCPAPFGQWNRGRGGKEYRGLRTVQHTYCRDLDGPWLLYDNHADPYQLTNLVDSPEHADLLADLDARLSQRLADNKDGFLPGSELIERCGYVTDRGGTVDFKIPFNPANITRRVPAL